MAATLTHRHRHKCALIAALSLPHDTPLIEWHDWVAGGLEVLIPYGATGWVYKQISASDSADYSGIGVDDSSWSTGQTALGHDESLGMGDVVTSWAPDTRLWLRKWFTGATSAQVTVRVEDNCTIWVNGHLVGSTPPHGIASDLSEHVFDIAPAYLDSAGNLLVIRADDEPEAFTSGDNTYINAQVMGVSTTPHYGWLTNPERTAALIDYAATHGRPTPTQNTDPLAGTVHLARYLLDALPAVGDRFRLTLNADVAAALGVADADRPRFTGEVTDLDLDAAGDLSVVTVNGLGRRGRLNRLPVTMDRPAELDGERVRRILAQATTTLPLEVGTIEPGTVQLLESAPRAVAAQQLVDQVTADSLGQLVEHRSGRLDYHDAGHRRGRTAVVTLTGAEHLIQPFTWRQSVASIINDATATYGPSRDQVRVVDPNSADPDTGAGPYGVQLDTQLAGSLDAYALLTNLVGRYAVPSWWLPAVLVELYRTAGDQLAALLALTHGDKITATDLPPDGAFTAGDVFVEGTAETHTAAGWRIELAVADPRLAGAGLRWIDLPRFLRWVDVDPALQWLDLATITDPYALGVPVAGGGDADDTAVLIVNGGTASTTSFDYVLSGALP